MWKRDPEVGVTFEEVNEQVTAKDEVNLRSTMDQGDDSNVVTRLLNEIRYPHRRGK